MLHIREFNEIEALAELRPVWSALLGATPGANFFQTLEWLEVYWKHFGAGQKLRVLLVTEGDVPQGIVPLVVRRETSRVGRVRFLTYPLDYWGSCYGPIGPTPEPALTAALGHIRRTSRDWDAIELRWSASRESDAWTERAMRARGLQACRTTLDTTALVRLSGTWEEYLAARTSKWRNNYRRWQRRLAERGEARHLRYRPRGAAEGEADPRWDLFEACLTIAQASWQGSSQDGTTLSHPAVRPFLTEVHATAAPLGALDVNLLVLDDVPIAFAYNYVYRGYVFGLRVGYNAEASGDGAGNLLYARIIEDSYRRGDWLYDLGPGSLECKRYFHTELQGVARFSHFPLSSPRAQLLRLKRNFDLFQHAEPVADQPTAALP